MSRLRLARVWNRTVLGQLTHAGRSYNPCHITSPSSIKSGLEKEVGKGCASEGSHCSEIHWALVCSWEMIKD